MKVRYRALSLILSVMMVLTFMPAMAFAEGEEKYRDCPLSVELTPVGDYTAMGYYASDYYDEELDEWVPADEEFLRFNTPELAVGDKLTVLYKTYDADGNEGVETIEYVGVSKYDEEYDEYDVEFVATNNEDDVLYPDVRWMYNQTPENAFAPDTDQDFIVRVGWDDDNNEVYTTGTAHLYADVELPWHVDNDEYDHYLENGKAVLTVDPVYEGEGTPTFTYQWFQDEYNENAGEDEGRVSHKKLSGETGKSYTATAGGYYSCEVTLSVNGLVSEEEVRFSVYGWKIISDYGRVPTEYGKSATLKVETNYSGNKDDISYQWYTWTYDEATEEGDYKPIEGATDATYIIPEVTDFGEYRCNVTINGQSQDVWFNVEVDTDDYEWTTTYPDAEVTFTGYEGRKLTYSFENGNYDDLFVEGDMITVKNGVATETYIFREDEGWFINENDEEDRLECYVDTDTIDASSKTQKAYVGSEQITNHEEKKIIRKYDTSIDLEIDVTTDVSSISFSPSSITLYSEDVKETYDGRTYYYTLGKRDPNAYRYDEDGTFLQGDKLTVKYTNGTTKVYVYDSREGAFMDGDETVPRPFFEDYELDAGNNAVKLYYQGRFTKVNVFIDTPQMRADRLADAEWNGVLSSKIPAAKSVKAKVGKKRATVSWKKATKKNLKKFDKIEIQISNNKQFDRKNPLTKRFLVKKSKKNYTIKKLKKGTYYVRVRHVKGTGATKQVSKWSAAKKVKIKK